MMAVRRGMFLVLLFILVSALAFAGGQGEGAEGESAKPVTLRMSTHHPADVYRSVGTRLLKEEIEKATNGLVKIDIYYSESLAAGREVLDAVKDGVVDIGDVNPAYYPKKLPLHSGILVYTKAPPRHSQKKEVMTRAYEKYPEFLAELEQYNQKLLWQYYPTPLNLSSTKPVKSIEDFAGLKIRASSEEYLRMLEELGAIPVSVPFTDCYMALQTGTIDGVFTNIAAMSGQRFYEPAPYSFTSAEMSIWLPFTFTINMDTWNSFSPEIQEQINQAVANVEKRFGPLYDEEYEIEVALFRDNGKELVKASKEDVETWQNLDIIEELKAELAKDAEAAGIANGDQFVDDIETFMEEAVQ